jgi:hypothetical protein
MPDGEGIAPESTKPSQPARCVALIGAIVLLALVFLAIEIRHAAPLRVPVASCVLAMVAASLALRAEAAVVRRLLRWRAPVVAAVGATVFLASGGVAYTYGGGGDLALEATPDAEPLEFGSVANHSVLFAIHNRGSGAVRLVPWELSLIVENQTGAQVYGGYTCPVATRGPAMDRDAIEIGPDQRIEYLVNFTYVPGRLSVPCQFWLVLPGSALWLRAQFYGADGVLSLPHWAGELNSNALNVTT